MTIRLQAYAAIASAAILAAACTPSNTPENVTQKSVYSLNKVQLMRLDRGDDARNENAAPALAVTDTKQPTVPQISSVDMTNESAGDESQNEAAFAWTPSDGDVIDFKVLRKGNDFGSHTITFSGDPEGEMNVQSEVSLRAGLGPITLYRYSLDTTETWKDGMLVGLSGSGNNDGDDLKVSASAEGDQLSIQGTEFSGKVDIGIIPSSHWNIQQVKSDRMVSTEDGEIIEISTEKVGSDTVVIDGSKVSATKYLLSADIDLDLWYDDEARLIKLAFETQGQNIEYVLTKLY